MKNKTRNVIIKGALYCVRVIGVIFNLTSALFTGGMLWLLRMIGTLIIGVCIVVAEILGNRTFVSKCLEKLAIHKDKTEKELSEEERIKQELYERYLKEQEQKKEEEES